MSDETGALPPLESDDEPALRRYLIEKGRATGNPAYHRAAAALLRDGEHPDRADLQLILDTEPERGRGRPEADDRLLLEYAAYLMLRYNITKDAACRRVAGEFPGHSEEATQKRLSRKLREEDASRNRMARTLVVIERQREMLWNAAQKVMRGGRGLRASYKGRD